MLLRNQRITVLLLMLLNLEVNTQSCTTENPCPNPAIKEVGVADWEKVRVSSNCTGTYETPEGTPNVVCPLYNGTALVDKRLNTVTNIAFKEEVLDTFWISSNTFISATAFREESIEYELVDRFLIRTIDLIFRSPSGIPHDMRPRAMKFQGKDANEQWVDWGYFAEDCSLAYNRQPSDLLFNSHPWCTARLSVDPGFLEVSFRPIEYFKANLYQDQVLYSFFTTSAIRVVFKTPPITNKLETSYYVVADVSIKHQCACFGHGSVCGGENGGQCMCLHNTGGSNCQECLPLYNNKPWQMSLSNQSFECDVCNCNNRSLSCVYDALEKEGRCTDCQHNTTGRHCESCQQHFHLNPEAGVVTGSCSGATQIGVINYNCGDVCIPCNCSQSGSQFLGTPCNPTTGQCDCKVNVVGRSCEACKDGYYNLDAANPNGCTQCDCDTKGMVSCDKISGACQCKRHTIGPNCIGCELRYYNLSGANPDGCTYCDCEMGRSEQQTCDSVAGDCNCRSGTTGRDCRGVSSTFFAPFLDFLTFEAEYAANISDSNLVQTPGGGQIGSTFTGRGHYKVTRPPPPLTQPSITLSISVLASAHYQIIIRYKSDMDFPRLVSSLGTAVNLSTSGILDDACINATATQVSTTSISKASVFSAMTPEVCLTKNLEYSMTLTFQGDVDPTKEILVDSVVLLPVLNSMGAYQMSIDSVKKAMVECVTASQEVLYYTKNSSCTGIGNSVMVDLNRAAYPCQCDLVGSLSNQCEAEGGQCPCKPNTLLRNCSQCDVYSYGFESINGCTECSCNANGSISLFCSDNGVCQCKQNVASSMCDQCLDKHYGLYTGNGCVPCNCGGIYVLNDSCLDSGQCFCKPGVGGIKCDQCALGFYGLTDDGCTSCGCDLDGSVDVSCHHMAGGCQCKPGVEGPQCNQCKSGYYGLGPYSADGCLKCYCSGQSSNCTSASKWYKAVSQSQWNVLGGDVFGERWSGLESSGKSHVLEKQVYLNDETQMLRMVNNASDTSPLYFVSPLECKNSIVTSPSINSSTFCFVGYKTPSYGQTLRFTLASNPDSVLPTPPPTNSSLPPTAPVVNFPYPRGDVVINGANTAVQLVANLPAMPSISPTDYYILINELNWFKNNVSLAVRPTYAEVMAVLYNVKSIYIRSKFSNVLGSAAYLFKVEMDYAVEELTGVDVPATNVEECVCAAPYEGRYCERCIFGFTKSKLVVGECVKCECNKHEYPGTACHAETGVCNCTHHSLGEQCELCMTSYYGEATLGQPDSCKACMCPGDVTNPSPSIPVHSSTKECTNTGADSFECTCDKGYMNDMCDECASGFYGHPSNSSFNGGLCTKCDCNNYNDDNCDPFNGTCRACGGNTTGFGCGQCQPGHYAFDFKFTKRCQACNCNGGASLGCNNHTGACNCQTGVALTTGCSECDVGHYAFTNDGCTACDCFIGGTDGQSPNCSSAGVCACGVGFEGDKCGSCKDDNYGITCEVPCNCQVNYTVNGHATCNITNGQCNCLQGFTGKTCDTCLPYAGKAYEGINAVVKSASIFPSCSSCGECFDDIASKSSQLNVNLIDYNTKIEDLKNRYYPSIDPTVLENHLLSIRDSFHATNSSNLQLQNLIDFKNNISFFSTDQRILQYESRLSSIESNKNTLQLSMIPLREINSNNLNTQNPLKPVVSLTNVRNTLSGLIATQKSITSEAEDVYSAMNRHDALVKNLPTAISQLTLRVSNANSSFSGLTASLQASDSQLDNIDAGKFKDDIIRADYHQKTVTSEVDVLAEDMITARYYTSVSAVMYKNGSERLLQVSSVYSTLNSQFSLNSNISRMAVASKNAAEFSHATVSNLCNTSQRLHDSVVYLMTNLSRDRESLDAPTLSQYDTTMAQIGNTNIDPQSNQIGSLASSIFNQPVPTDTISTIAQLADSSSTTGQSLTGTITLAVTKTQEAKSDLEGLQRNLQSTVTQQTDAQSCLDTASNHGAYVRSTILFISSKANQTSVAATTTADALLSNTNTTTPIKQAFQAVSDNITNSLNSIQLSNTSIADIQTDFTNTASRVPALTISVVTKKTQHDTWIVTKNQLHSCVDDIWTLFNALNQPVSINALLDHTNSQSAEVQQLNTDIINLEKELEGLQSTLSAIAEGGVSCRNILPS